MKKIFKSKIRVAILVAFVLMFAYTVTSLAADAGLITTIKDRMKNDINAQTDQKIVDMNTAIKTGVENALTGKKDAEVERISGEVQAYLDRQLASANTGSGLTEANTQLEIYANSLIQQEKARVDSAIASALNG